MTDKITIPYNDVFFYGVSLRARDVADVRSDIFANIMMRYLRTLKPVSSKLYRTADGSRYEYSYSFIPSKPLSWRVIKNRRIIEEIEQLSDSKYCLNYYDDQGNDVKRILFSNQHRWQKTNYYNTIYGDDLLCSIVPKELNGQTVILQYTTGETYPVTLHCCPVASCSEVLQNVLSRVPEPEAMALTNYGILYYASEETLNIYKQVLTEEEAKYAQAHKPEVFTTDEDVAGGFCFDVSNFDSTKNIGSMFDLSEAQELTEEGFASVSEPAVAAPDQEDRTEVVSNKQQEVSEPASPEIAQISDDKGEYSLDADISEAIKIITDATAVHIDEEIVFGDFATADEEPLAVEVSPDADLEAAFDHISISVEDAEVSDGGVESFVIFDEPVTAKEAVPVPQSSQEPTVVPDEDTVADSVAYSPDAADLLSMGDEDIDDYVQTLIDSLLLDAKSAVSEYAIGADDAFTAGADEAVVDSSGNAHSSSEEFITENTPDAILQSNGADYFYYGATDDSGNRSGRGKTLMTDGKTAYDGEYKDDMRHGVGSFYYKDGSLCYWGDWKQNLRNGFGVGVSSETGIVHMGSWQKNKPVGIGVRFDSEGRFMYLDSNCERTNGGIRITGFTDRTLTVEFWDEKTLKTVKKEISRDDLLN